MTRTALALAAMTVAAASDAHAQAKNYQIWRVDSGIAGAYALGTGAAGGGGVAEIKFNVLDQVSAGVRFDGVITFGGNFGLDGGENVSVGLGVQSASLLKGEYFFTNGGARPFVGLGAGMYAITSQNVDTNPDGATILQQAGRYFGLAPQIGVDLGRLRLGATFNWIVAADVEVTQMVGGNEEITRTSQNYVTFEMLIRFGGRKKVRR